MKTWNNEKFRLSNHKEGDAHSDILDNIEVGDEWIDGGGTLYICTYVSRKEDGEFESYDEAYQFGADHYTKDGQPFEANQLKRNYHKCDKRFLNVMAACKSVLSNKDQQRKY